MLVEVYAGMTQGLLRRACMPHLVQYLLTYLLTCLLTYLLTCLLTYLLTCLLMPHLVQYLSHLVQAELPRIPKVLFTKASAHLHLAEACALA